MVSAASSHEQLGPFRLVRPLGEGGGGRVWLAHRVVYVDGAEQIRTVAVKEARIGPNEAIEQNEANLRREFLVGANIQHPNVCTLLSCLRVDQRLLLEMEYIDGLDVHQIMGRLTAKGVLPPPSVAVELIMQASAGLHAIHIATDRDGRMELVHRDVKPENLMVSRHGVLKILDLGITRGTVARSQHTSAGVLRGTRQYMAPEQHRDDQLGPATDVFALGAVLYELLTGAPLYPESEGDLYEAKRQGHGLERLQAHSSRLGPLATVIARCIQPQHEQRYARARDLEDVLRVRLQALGPSLGLPGLMKLLYGEPLQVPIHDLSPEWRTLERALGSPRRPMGISEMLRRVNEVKRQHTALTPVTALPVPATVERPIARADGQSQAGAPLRQTQPQNTTPTSGNTPTLAVAPSIEWPQHAETSAASNMHQPLRRSPRPQGSPNHEQTPHVEVPLLPVPSDVTEADSGGRRPAPVIDWRHLQVAAGATLLLSLIGGAWALGTRLGPSVLSLTSDLPCFSDQDGDGVGGVAPLEVHSEACDGPGEAKTTGDCNDAIKSIFPGAEELVDGVDNNCDGVLADGEGDADKDGTLDAKDCAPDDPEIHPAAIERPGDGVDQDCDQRELCFEDQDNDGWGAVERLASSMDCQADVLVQRGGDCDDNLPKVHPERPERMNARDDDCDGLIDEDVQAQPVGDPPWPPRGDPDPPTDPEPPVVPPSPSLRRTPTARLEKEGRRHPFALSVSGTIQDTGRVCVSRTLSWRVANGKEGTVSLPANDFNITVQDVGTEVSAVQFKVHCKGNLSTETLKEPSGRSDFTVKP